LAEWTVEESLKRVYSANENDILLHIGRLMKSEAGFYLVGGGLWNDNCRLKQLYKQFYLLGKSTDLSEERIASIYRVEK
jgi:hypothetical protein